MDALEAINTRRPFRRYTDEPVADEHVRELLRAAMCAPSGYGQRSARSSSSATPQRDRFDEGFVHLERWSAEH